jgi:hypothetical protein
LQDGEQDSSIKSMQEVEAFTLEIGIAQGIDDSSSSKELLVLVSLLSSFPIFPYYFLRIFIGLA